MKRVPFFVLMTGILLLLAAAGLTYLSSKPQGTAMARHPLQEVTAYTSLPTEAAAALSEAYEKEYNIRVNFVALSAGQVLSRLEEQSKGGKDPAALVLVDRETLDRAAAVGYLVPYQRKVIR